MGLDTYAAKVLVEDGQRCLSTDLPSRVFYSTTVKCHDGSLRTITRSTADGFEKVPAMTSGMLSGDGNSGSFRGKCYAGLVQEVTGYSLYEEELPPPVVELMAADLRRSADMNVLKMPVDEAWQVICDPEAALDSDLYLAYDLNALACWFEACASKGYSVIGWW